MNPEEFLAALRTRRSVRRFRTEAVSRVLLERLVEHAAWAPSASNRQDWFFAIVTHDELKRALGEVVRERWREIVAANQDSGSIEEIAQYAAHFSEFAAAPAVIAVACREPDGLQRELLDADAELVGGSFTSAAMAAQNLMLAAHALGLGTCCYTGALAAHAGLSRLLSLPQRHKLVCLISVGVPDERPAPPARKPVDKIVRFAE